MHWVDLAEREGLIESSCKHGNKPTGSIKLGEFRGYVKNRFLRRTLREEIVV